MTAATASGGVQRMCGCAVVLVPANRADRRRARQRTGQAPRLLLQLHADDCPFGGELAFGWQAFTDRRGRGHPGPASTTKGQESWASPTSLPLDSQG